MAVCHPFPLSLRKVTVASLTPQLDHSEPVWVPVLPVPLKKRTPYTEPEALATQRTPTSTPVESLTEAFWGFLGPKIVSSVDVARSPARWGLLASAPSGNRA